MAQEQPALELELEDRDRLLHPREPERVDPRVAGADVLGRERLGRIAGVRDARQRLDRRERDPVALLELARALVAQREPDHRRDRRRVAEARRDPVRVVVADRDRHVRLLLEHLDHLVEARPAVAEVPGDDELAHREVAHDPRDQADQLELALVAHERIDDPLDERRLAAELGREQQLLQDRIERRRDQLLDVLDRVAPRQVAHHGDGVRGEREHARAARRRCERGDRGLVGLARVVEELEQLAELRRVAATREHALDQRAQAAGGVVDHLAQLDVLAVDVAHDVHRRLREREDRLEVGELGERGRRVRVALGQGPQVHELHDDPAISRRA
jgi:hypothetical protein